MRNGARLAQPDCCSDSDQRAARPREWRRKSLPQGARLPAGCCIPRPAAVPRSPASWHAAVAASSASTVSSSVCSVDPLRHGRRPGHDGPGRDRRIGDQRAGEHPAPAGQPGVQLDELPQHRPPGPGHVPAHGGLTRRLSPVRPSTTSSCHSTAASALSDQLQPHVHPAARADDQRLRDRRPGRPPRPARRGSTATPPRRRGPGPGPGWPRSPAAWPGHRPAAAAQSDRSSPASGPAAEPTSRSSHRPGSSPRTCRSVSGGAQLSSPSTPPGSMTAVVRAITAGRAQRGPSAPRPPPRSPPGQPPAR